MEEELVGFKKLDSRHSKKRFDITTRISCSRDPDRKTPQCIGSFTSNPLLIVVFFLGSIATMSFLFPFVIPILSFFLQSYPRFFNKLFGVDVWTRLLEVDHVRKSGHRIPVEKLSGQFIVDGYFDYPPLFPILLSYFSKKRLLAIQGFVAPFFDALQVALVYVVTVALTGNHLYGYLAQLLYAATPMIAIENSYLTPRSFGYLNFSLATIPLLLSYHWQNSWLGLVGLFFACTLFLSHRFALQSFFFLTIFFTFYLNRPIFIQAFLVGFVIALILTKGYYLRVLKGHLFNIYFWIHNLDFRFAHQVRGVLKKETKTDLVGNIYKYLSIFSPIAIFGTNPWAVSALVVIGAQIFGWFIVPPLMLTFAVWVAFFYCVAVFVLKVKYLMPIGEGYRYMEMATVPSVILSVFVLDRLLATSLALPAKIGMGFLVFFNLAMIVFFQLKTIIHDRNRSVTSDLSKVFRYINKQKKSLRVICVPHQNTTVVVYMTKASVFVNADNPGLMRIQEVYPILKIPLKQISKKYGLTHALVKESFVTLKELKLTSKQVVFESGDVKLVRL
jgi:hypothetical protein